MRHSLNVLFGFVKFLEWWLRESSSIDMSCVGMQANDVLDNAEPCQVDVKPSTYVSHLVFVGPQNQQ